MERKLLWRGAICLAMALAMPGELRADWPMARHDVKRGGAAPGKSNITRPAVHWQYYLGGQLSPRQVVFFDTDKDGKKEVVHVAGGRLLARQPDDTAVWIASPKDMRTMWGLFDLDGDGAKEVVASSNDRAYIFSASTGKILWAEPEGEMGTINALRLSDLDGDGLPELVVVECWCCAVSSKKPGFVYSFAKGFAKASLLWKLPFAYCGGGTSLVLADMDGAKPAEVALASDKGFSLLDGKTGAELAKSADLGTSIQKASCRGADLDGKAGQELVCALNEALAVKERRQVFALKYESKSLKLLWKKIVAPDKGGDMAWADLVTDLDGDGKPEVLVSGSDGTAWTTWVLDGATGKQLGELKGQRVAGTATLEHAKKRVVLTTSKDSLSVWAYTKGAATPLTARWSLAKLKPNLQHDPDQLVRGNLHAVVSTLDLDGDGLQDLVLTNSEQPGKLQIYSGKGGKAKLLATHLYPAGTRAMAAWAAPAVTTSRPQVASLRFDGELILHDKALTPTPKLGVRVGGYYASGRRRDFRAPRLARLDSSSKVDAIVVATSRSALLRLDAREATLTAPPKKVWEKLNTFSPTVVKGLDKTSPGIACFGYVSPITTPPKYRVLGLRVDGTTLWSKHLDHMPFNDLLPATLNKDGVTDLVYQWGKRSDLTLRTRALSGASGLELWSSPAVSLGGNRNPSGITVTDWDKDGLDDVIFQGMATRVLSGADGKEIAKGGPPDPYFMITLVDIDGDGTDELVYHSGGPTRIFKKDLKTMDWKSTVDDREFPYAAVTRCSGEPVLVTTSYKTPAQIKLTQLAKGKLGTATTVVLAGGKPYANSAAAKASGALVGQLTSPTVHGDLTGKGRPSVLVGSTDGWLYAMDPCTAKLDFTLQFPSAVGAAVFGDTDGDGLDEVLVSVANGFLYALKQQKLAKPDHVWDTDPDKGITTDVDTIDTTDKLSASWGSVVGAKEYRVAVMEYRGAIISDPKWRSVGTSTKTSISGLPLKAGVKYLFAVRAVGQDGSTSSDALSDGVVIKLSPPGGDALPDAGADAAACPECECQGGCGCATGGEGAGSMGVILALVLAFVVRRRHYRR